MLSRPVIILVTISNKFCYVLKNTNTNHTWNLSKIQTKSGKCRQHQRKIVLIFYFFSNHSTRNWNWEGKRKRPKPMAHPLMKGDKPLLELISWSWTNLSVAEKLEGLRFLVWSCTDLELGQAKELWINRSCGYELSYHGWQRKASRGRR